MEKTIKSNENNDLKYFVNDEKEKKKRESQITESLKNDSNELQYFTE